MKAIQRLPFPVQQHAHKASKHLNDCLNSGEPAHYNARARINPFTFP